MAANSHGELRVSSSIAGVAYDEARGFLYVTYRMSAENDEEARAYLVNGIFHVPDAASAEACTLSLIERYGMSPLHNWN